MITILYGDSNHDHDAGTIHWPVNEGDCPDIDDAYYTLYSLADAQLEVTFYDEAGEKETDTLYVEFINLYEDDCEGKFARQPLKELLEREYERCLGEDNPDRFQTKLVARLLKAFNE